jgi:uncharacterized protein
MWMVWRTQAVTGTRALARDARSQLRLAVLITATTLALAAVLSDARATEEEKQAHRLVIQISENNPDLMSLSLNNAVNATQHYGGLGEEIEVEIVAYGPGLHMLREDTSPVKARVKSMAESLVGVVFTACGNTMDTMAKAEGKPVPILPQAKIVKTGVARIMELQERGWTYVRP